MDDYIKYTEVQNIFFWRIGSLIELHVEYVDSDSMMHPGTTCDASTFYYIHNINNGNNDNSKIVELRDINRHNFTHLPLFCAVDFCSLSRR